MRKIIQWVTVIALIFLMFMAPLKPIESDDAGQVRKESGAIHLNENKELKDTGYGLMVPGIENKRISDALIGVSGLLVLGVVTFSFDRLAKRHRAKMRRLRQQYEERARILDAQGNYYYRQDTDAN